MFRRAVVCLAFLAVAAAARAATWPDHPVLHAVRVTTSPVLDGDLSDPAWQNAPEFTDFTQHDPDDGKPATLKTTLKIVYDENAIYFGAKMYDPQRPMERLARRDSFTESDFLSINLDPQLDRLSGNAFTINPSNVQVDTVLYNDIGEDPSWDGVWDSAVKIVPDGWVAEVRIPFSQLRFKNADQQVWGINVTRRTARTNEMVRIVNTKKGETGFVSHFADIVGIENVRRGRSLEIVPYGVARSDHQTGVDSTNPLAQSQEQHVEAGLDLKYAVTPRLTLTGTINPDFGQVEVDPAVVNLSQFETFYPEKRPFFTEGVQIFRFGDSPAPSHFNFINPPSTFYSRRIGRAPQITPDAWFVDTPAQTRILGAAKLSGVAGAGWTLGVLDALTDDEYAKTWTAGVQGREQVEPMTNYFVGRATKAAGDGARVGFMASSVVRQLDDTSAPLLRRSATTAGVDGYKSFGNRSWILEGEGMVTRVTGSEEAIASTQTSSARYYQRPDAGHVTFDPTRTSLSGWGGRAMFSKATGLWRPIVQLQAYSPGLETNDVGFMQRTDILSGAAIMQYVDQTPTSRFREKNIWFGTWQNVNFDHDTLERAAFVMFRGTFANYWQYDAEFFGEPGAFTDRLTRGGPVARTPHAGSTSLELETDNRKNVYMGVEAHIDGGGDGSHSYSAGISINARPRANVVLSLEPEYSFNHDYTQYVATIPDPTATATYGQRYVFGTLNQKTFELGTRVDWTLTSRLSFQVYLQPFVASGDYVDFHSLVAPRTRDFEPYPYPHNPDFNVRSLRGNAVFRWEFRPGSALYVAWNENRAEYDTIGNLNLHRDLRSIATAPSHDVFLVKLSYWLPM